MLIAAATRPRWLFHLAHRMPWRVSPFTALIVLPLVSVAYPSAVHLLGDGYLLIRELDAEAWERLARTDRAPLTFWILIRLHRVLHWAGQDAEFTYRAVSVLSGLAYAVLSPVVAATLSEERRRRTIISAFLLTAGYVQLFCGYVENYAPLYPGMLLLIALLINAVRKRGPLWPASLLLGILCSLHFSTAFLIPGVVAAGHLYSRSRGILRSAIEGVPFPISVLSILWLIGFDFSTYISEARSHTLPLFDPVTHNSAYTLLSAAHVGDLLNVLLLSAPLVLIVLPSVRPRDLLGDDVKTVLVTMLAGPFLFVFVANPEIGAFRDWDVLSLPALPLLILTAYSWSARNPQGRVVVFVVGAAALHTFLWIGLNADAASASLRYKTLLKTVPLSTHGKVYGWETMGSYSRENGNSEGSIEAYTQALDANPNHGRLWLLLGNAYQQIDRLEEAASAYGKTLQIEPRMREAHSNLGVIKVRKGQYQEALEHLDRAIGIAPDFPDAHMNRGVALANIGRRDEAITSLRRAVALDPGYGNAYKNLATLYLQAGRRDSARYFQLLARTREELE